MGKDIKRGLSIGLAEIGVALSLGAGMVAVADSANHIAEAQRVVTTADPQQLRQEQNHYALSLDNQEGYGLGPEMGRGKAVEALIGAGVVLILVSTPSRRSMVAAAS